MSCIVFVFIIFSSCENDKNGDSKYLEESTFNEDGYAIVSEEYDATASMIYKIINKKGETILENGFTTLRIYEDENLIYGIKRCFDDGFEDFTGERYTVLYDYKNFELLYWNPGINLIPSSENKMFYDDKWCIFRNDSFQHGVMSRDFQVIIDAEYSESFEPIAYMDLETADEEMRGKILEARNKIIFSKSWVADGIESGGADPDNNTVTVPQFYDIFPLDWDIPTNINN